MEGVGSWTMFGPSLLSILGCLSVILILAVLKQRSYLKIIEYICLSDLLSCCGSIIGYQHDNTGPCTFQAIFTTWFQLSSLAWTVTLTALLLNIIVTGRTFSADLFWVQGINWGLPLLITLLPLTTNRYGYEYPFDDDVHKDSYTAWCFVGVHEKSHQQEFTSSIWIFASFYVEVWLSLLLIVIFFFIIRVRTNTLELKTAPLILEAFKKLLPYPIVIVICYTLPTANRIYALANPSGHRAKQSNSNIAIAVESVINITLTSQGLLTSIIFFYMEHATVRESITRWKFFIHLIMETLREGKPLSSIDLEISIDRKSYTRKPEMSVAKTWQGGGSYSQSQVGVTTSDLDAAVTEVPVEGADNTNNKLTTLNLTLTHAPNQGHRLGHGFAPPLSAISERDESVDASMKASMKLPTSGLLIPSNTNTNTNMTTVTMNEP